MRVELGVGIAAAESDGVWYLLPLGQDSMGSNDILPVGQGNDGSLCTGCHQKSGRHKYLVLPLSISYLTIKLALPMDK
jgi:hypothetical protein